MLNTPLCKGIANRLGSQRRNFRPLPSIGITQHWTDCAARLNPLKVFRHSGLQVFLRETAISAEQIMQCSMAKALLALLRSRIGPESRTRVCRLFSQQFLAEVPAFAF